MSFHIPDRFFTRITQIDVQKDLLDLGFNNCLLDVDNTILTRDESIVPKDVLAWLNNAQEKGINFCLISNDWHKNVVDLSKEIGLPIVVRALKPLPFAYFKAMKKIGSNKTNTISIGDQLMTDVFGAHVCGLKCYLLKPLVEKDLIHTLFLRKLEKLILNGRKPEPLRMVKNAI